MVKNVFCSICTFMLLIIQCFVSDLCKLVPVHKRILSEVCHSAMALVCVLSVVEAVDQSVNDSIMLSKSCEQCVYVSNNSIELEFIFHLFVLSNIRYLSPENVVLAFYCRGIIFLIVFHTLLTLSIMPQRHTRQTVDNIPTPCNSNVMGKMYRVVQKNGATLHFPKYLENYWR